MKTARLVACLFAAFLGNAQTNPISELYYVVFLRPDPARKPIEKNDLDRMQTEHMANIRRMAASGVLVAAGPFDEAKPQISGLFVFRSGPGAETLEGARRLAGQDPTVAGHRNLAEVYGWHGPRGIGEEYARLHKADPQTPEDMGIHPLWMLWRGPSWADNSPLLRAHEAYLEELRRQGKLAVSGGIDPNSDGLAALAVFQRIPEAESRALMEADPAVKAELLRAEYHGWWSAAHVLPQVRQL